MVFMHEHRDVSLLSRKDGLMRYVVVLAWCTIVIGIFLRLTQLPTRAVYGDEEYTQLRVAGHTAREMITTFYNGRPTTALTLTRFAQVDSSATPQRLVSSLEQEDSQHPPLFYLAELAFIKVVGNSLFFWRLLPALFGILAIPAAYALARELFKSNHAGLLAAAMFAVSPIERIYSEQAREYSLFALIVLLTTLAVIRANRFNSLGTWSIYAILAALGLYTDPIMAYVMAGHAVFIAGTAWNSRRLSALVAFGGAATLALITYLPWIYQMVIHRNDITQTNVWSGTHWPFLRLVAKWVFNTGTTFFDLEYINLRWGAVAFAAVALVAAVTIIRGFQKSEIEARWCLGAAVVIPAILLIAPDIILGQHRSSVARYGLPVFAMLAIISARGLVARPISTTAILGAALCSCVFGSLHASWWDNDSNADDARIARAISAIPRAQVITTIAPPMFIVFARRLDPSTRISFSSNLLSARYSRGEPLVVFFPTEDDLRFLRKRTGLHFMNVPYMKALTAHDIGTSIAAGSGAPSSTDLYVASDVDVSSR